MDMRYLNIRYSQINYTINLVIYKLWKWLDDKMNFPKLPHGARKEQKLFAWYSNQMVTRS